MINYILGEGRFIFVPSSEQRVEIRGTLLPTNEDVRELISELASSKSGKFIAIQFEDSDDFSDLKKTKDTVVCADFNNESKIEKYNKDKYIVIMKADVGSIVKLEPIKSRG